MRNGIDSIRWLNALALVGLLTLGCGGEASSDNPPPPTDTPVPDTTDTAVSDTATTDVTPPDDVTTDVPDVSTDTTPPEDTATDASPPDDTADVEDTVLDVPEPDVQPGDEGPSPDMAEEDVPEPEDTDPPEDTPPAEDTAVDVPPEPDVPVVDAGTEDSIAPQTCALHQSCLDADFCTKDLCTDGSCGSEGAGCDDGDPCTDDSCDSAVGCVHTPSTGAADCEPMTVIHEALFDDGTASGFSISDLAVTLEGDASPAVWTPDPLHTHSGAGALYMGIPGTYNFDTGEVVKTEAWSADIAVPSGGGVTLQLWTYLDVEPETDWDVLSVMVSTDGASIPVWTKSSSNTVQKQWQLLSINLTAFVGKTIQVGLRFDSVEHTFNDTLGVVVDTVRLTQSGTVASCSTDGDCDDGLSCTTETCEQSVCVYAVGSCCQSDSDCDDSDACTADLCGADNACQFVPVSTTACCNTTDDCADGNSCTSEVCADNVCQYTPVVGEGCCTSNSQCNDNDVCTIDTCNEYNCQSVNTCCQADGECDDGDDLCTIDTCVNGACKFTTKSVPGCCSPTLFEATFEDNSLDGWTMVSPSPVCKWAIETGPSSSPSNALFFGNPVTNKVDCLNANGKATTPPIPLPDVAGAKLEFQFYAPPVISTDPFGGLGTTFTVTVIPATGTNSVVFSKLSNEGSVWTSNVENLDQWKGQTVQFQFYALGPPQTPFSNGSGGPVYVDDVRVTQPCAP